jgi:DNA-binding transcriptional LysR family regulator
VYGRGPGVLTMQSNAVLAACQAAGFNPRVGHVAPDNLSRLNLVAAGLGIAVVSSLMQRMNFEGIVYRRLKGAAFERDRRNMLTRATASFLAAAFAGAEGELAAELRASQVIAPPPCERARRASATTDAGAPDAWPLPPC